jgi:hypothetical protein
MLGNNCLYTRHSHGSPASRTETETLSSFPNKQVAGACMSLTYSTLFEDEARRRGGQIDGIFTYIRCVPSMSEATVWIFRRVTFPLAPLRCSTRSDELPFVDRSTRHGAVRRSRYCCRHGSRFGVGRPALQRD